MRNLTIGTRLALGFGVVILLLITLAGIGLWRIQDSNQANQLLQGRELNNALILQWARQTEANNNLTLAATNLSDPDAQALAVQGLKQSDARIESLHKQLGDTIQHPTARALYQQAQADQDAYFKQRDAAFKALENWDTSKAQTFFSREMPVLSQKIIGNIDKLSTFQNDYTDQVFARTFASNQLGMIVLGIATVLALMAKSTASRSRWPTSSASSTASPSRPTSSR